MFTIIQDVVIKISLSVGASQSLPSALSRGLPRRVARWFWSVGGERHMFIKGLLFQFGSAKSKMTLSTKDIHKSCHKMSNRIVCFDLSHFDNTESIRGP